MFLSTLNSRSTVCPRGYVGTSEEAAAAAVKPTIFCRSLTAEKISLQVSTGLEHNVEVQLVLERLMHPGKTHALSHGSMP